MTLTLKTDKFDVAIDLSSKLLRYKLITILVKIRDVVYVEITNISLASCLTSRSRSLTTVTSPFFYYLVGLHIGWLGRYVKLIKVHNNITRESMTMMNTMMLMIIIIIIVTI